ncbi:MAG: Lrp/AsnC family transcriptional regulator [Alphaproteobacteria bacterium]|jgi:Lrp/AsnC family transcriptional regulator for asnA, asnC and gidA|nr:MAG: Lrp/AsnC family transcriptional regulator [Alphaproteobacteria bacterium]
MDRIDFLILGELVKDARMPFLEIAKKLGVSPFTVKSRYEKMVEEGIIFRSVIDIDLSKLGYQAKAFLFITTSSDGKSVAIEGLRKIQNIIVVSEIIGPFDLIAIAPITDLNSVKTLVQEVKKLPSIKRVKLSCVSSTMFPLNQSFGKLVSENANQLANVQPTT